MKTKYYNRFIDELTKIINFYVDNHSLFSGGCCYSAYLLTKALRTFGIKYKTVIFQYEDIINETDFTNAINGCGVSHVAVEVKYNRKNYIIGKCDSIYRYFNITGEEYKIKKYDNIFPEDLLDGYHNNEWNDMYDNTHINGILSRDINRVVERYINLK